MWRKANITSIINIIYYTDVHTKLERQLYLFNLNQICNESPSVLFVNFQLDKFTQRMKIICRF